MKKIDALAAEIENATQSGDGLDQLGRRLVAQHREYAVHVQNGSSYEDIGQSHIEEQIRLYLVYTLDRSMWEKLVTRTEQYAQQDRNAMAPMFSPWGYLNSDLVDNLGEGLGWKSGGPSKNLSNTSFPQRVGMIVSTLEGFTPAQLKQMEVSLGSDENVTPPKSGGCYVATAVYGSYDAPEVRVLRRWRDDFLKASATGREFVRFYYATSPKLVWAVGQRVWFVGPARYFLDRFVRRLVRAGYTDASHTDHNEMPGSR
ncbi:CFI-box-CTERM domain-containing protein [Agromyces bauzanensis]|uniref:Uncharacterized protein n=1 Tax=Agromyces bauzanensis TaxID=1308924 RepID=A0A917PG99_9MICO|nr:CFI-box-CTERM domain-containing protein [Agromyces bauzanensis]GGJ76431.1 hypothetical protein GCM10011372_13330 [Agromyces bauzanensis]